MTPYKFFFDRDSAKTAIFFPKKRVVHLADAGLPETAADRRIVEVACRNEWIIVTANGDDFLREIIKYLAQTKWKDCHDVRGLVIVPNQYQVQKRALRNIADRLRFSGKPISWAEVWNRSYCVRIKAVGLPEVRPLPRCFYCAKNEMVA